jgi:hypothetical protein
VTPHLKEKTMSTATSPSAVLTTHDVTIQTAHVAMQSATKETLWT